MTRHEPAGRPVSRHALRWSIFSSWRPRWLWDEVQDGQYTVTGIGYVVRFDN